METQQERPPAYDTAPLTLPSPPTTDPATVSAQSNLHLPDLRSLGLPPSHPSHSYKSSGDVRTRQWQGTNLLASAFPAVPTGLPSSSVEPALASPLATESVLSVDGNKASSVMSMDDPDTRMAAEALSGLRNLDYVRSPSSRSATLSVQQMTPKPESIVLLPQQQNDQEPLLSLVTANYPMLGGTINGSLSAYENTKYYSPAFIRSGAEFVERNIGSPVASTVASVGRISGVEGGIRRYLGDGKPSDLEHEDNRKRKRLRQSSPDADIEKGLHSPPISTDRRSRAGSQVSFAESLHSLPPYDENRSPGYEELAPSLLQMRQESQPPSPSRNWRTQLMITTSGLGAALSEVSLTNLRLCLRYLHSATSHLATIMHALKSLLQDHEQTLQSAESSNETGLSQEQEAASQRIAERIKEFHRDIMQTLEVVKNSISRYTGGALPENAGALVRRQLMSIPQRWRVAESAAESQQNGAAQNEDVRRGNKLFAFAGQSLDMIAQVTLIVGATIENAEGWLERMGKKKQRERERNSSMAKARSPPSQPTQLYIKDEKERADVVMGENK